MPSQHTAIPFDSVENTFKQFAKMVGGQYTFAPGISEQEVRLSKSELGKRIVYPLGQLFGEDPEQIKKQFDELYKNAYVDCEYRYWSIRFHIRNVGFGFQTPGKLALRITCPITPGDLRFLLCPRTLKPSKFQTAAVVEGEDIPWLFKPFIPEGILMSLESERRTFLIRCDQQELGAMYVARSTEKCVAERLLGDRCVQEFLLQLRDIYSWKIGYLDPRGIYDRLFELEESIDLGMEPLEISLKFTQTALDILFPPAP